MNKKDFRFWLTLIIVIGLSFEAGFYYRHQSVVKTRTIAAQEAAKQRAAELATGVITSKKFTRRDFVVTLTADGDVTINKDDGTYADINFTLPEENRDDVDDGQEITFVVDDLPKLFFKGEVYAMDSDANPDTHQFGLKAMASNPDNKLEAGMTAQIKLITGIHQNALVIPESAIIDKNGKNFVYAVDNSIAKLTPVTLGVQQDDVVEVTAGDIENKEIITSGTDHIMDGAPVIIDNSAS